jgi:CHAT domain-containing protein
LVISGEPDEDPLPQAPWINMTPWESLWDAKSREFLATAGSTFFSRAVGDSVIHRPRPRPLRILIMAAAPHVFEGRRLPQLSDYVEIKKIRAAANGVDCQVEVVPGESFEDLQLMLFKNSSARARFDVFHFIGHGDFDERRKEGYLLFREADGAGAVPIGASDLTELLSDPWAPLLVISNSCRGAQGNGGDIFSSTAATLSLGRLPAVIAMQFPVSDRAAIAFSKSLYLFLAQGATVQNAVRGARRTLKQQGPEWITPVLYLRDPAYSIVKSEDSS